MHPTKLYRNLLERAKIFQNRRYLFSVRVVRSVLILCDKHLKVGAELLYYFRVILIKQALLHLHEHANVTFFDLVNIKGAGGKDGACNFSGVCH